MSPGRSKEGRTLGKTIYRHKQDSWPEAIQKVSPITIKPVTGPCGTVVLGSLTLLQVVLGIPLIRNNSVI